MDFAVCILQEPYIRCNLQGIEVCMAVGAPVGISVENGGWHTPSRLFHGGLQDQVISIGSGQPTDQHMHMWSCPHREAQHFRIVLRRAHKEQWAVESHVTAISSDLPQIFLLKITYS